MIRFLNALSESGNTTSKEELEGMIRGVRNIKNIPKTIQIERKQQEIIERERKIKQYEKRFSFSFNPSRRIDIFINLVMYSNNSLFIRETKEKVKEI